MVNLGHLRKVYKVHNFSQNQKRQRPNILLVLAIVVCTFLEPLNLRCAWWSLYLVHGAVGFYSISAFMANWPLRSTDFMVCWPMWLVDNFYFQRYGSWSWFLAFSLV